MGKIREKEITYYNVIISSYSSGKKVYYIQKPKSK